ncbi:MAG: DVUA0089 family protein [Phycisphaerales bacterium]|nr:DVUA0089 family protein [Phycisphaerales bacterium]
MKTKISTLSVVIALGSLSGAAVAGPDWIEDGDAGSTLNTSQDITPVGPVQTIAGTLGGQDTEDVYKLVILDGDDIGGEVMFGLTLNQGEDMLFDPSLWLFDSEGFGVLGNDDDPILGGPDARLIAPSTDGVTLMLPPGIYFLAITESGNVPLSFRETPGLGEGVFEEIFFFEDANEVSGADGAGADNPLAAWSGGEGTAGGYGIEITPTPGGTALLAFAGVGLTRRRR